MKNKKGQGSFWDEIKGFAIPLIILVILFIVYLIVSGKMGGAIAYLKGKIIGGGNVA